MNHPDTCSHPDCKMPHSPEQRDAQIRRDIRRVGWSVMGVLGENSIAYTIGMTDRKWPELLFELEAFGTSKKLKLACDLLNAVGAKLVEVGEKPHHGQVITLPDAEGGQWHCRLSIRLNTAPLVQAKNFYRNRPISVMEVDLV